MLIEWVKCLGSETEVRGLGDRRRGRLVMPSVVSMKWQIGPFTESEGNLKGRSGEYWKQPGQENRAERLRKPRRLAGMSGGPGWVYGLWHCPIFPSSHSTKMGVCFKTFTSLTLVKRSLSLSTSPPPILIPNSRVLIYLSLSPGLHLPKPQCYCLFICSVFLWLFAQGVF